MMVRSIAILLLAVICIPGISQKLKSSKPQTLFSVNGEAVTTDEFMYLFKKNHQSKTDHTAEKVEEYLQLFLNFKLKVTEAKRRGIDTTAAFVKEFTSYKEELRKPYLPEGKMLDSLVRMTYERLREEIKASHILISLKPDAPPADTVVAYNRAAEIKKRILAGEDFGTLAAQLSEDPSAKLNKGDLGYFTAMQMVFAFENAAYKAHPGEVAGPVRTRFGYHLIKIEDRKPARGEVEVSHIMIRTNERDAASAKNLIFEIHDQLRGGVSWEDLCKQYSEDQSSRNNGGRLRAFGVGAMSAVPEFDRMAFSLQTPGEISDPFQTQYGWHVIRLEKKIPLPSLAESAQALKNKVARDERVQVSRAVMLQKLKQQFAFAENQEVKKTLFTLADTSLTKGRWRALSTHQLNNDWLISLNSRAFKVVDFLRYVKQNQKANSTSPDKYIDQLYTNWVEKLINEQFESQIISSNPEFELLVKEYYEGILLFDIMEKEIWNKASTDSIGQQNYFQSHATKYTAAERAVGTIYSGTTDALMQVRNYLDKGDSMAIQKLVESRAIRQETGRFQRADRPVLSKIPWKSGIAEAENNGIHYLVNVKAIIPPGSMTFEEARPMVITDFQDSLEKAWLQELKRKYPVKVNDKAKRNIIEKIKS